MHLTHPAFYFRKVKSAVTFLTDFWRIDRTKSSLITIWHRTSTQSLFDMFFKCQAQRQRRRFTSASFKASRCAEADNITKCNHGNINTLSKHVSHAEVILDHSIRAALRVHSSQLQLSSQLRVRKPMYFFLKCCFKTKG